MLAKSKIVSWSDARDRGLKHYFTGEACQHGHIALRSTGDRTCVECRRVATRTRRHNKKMAAPPRQHPEWGKFLCGVAVKKGELESYANTGKLPFRIMEKSGMFMPALDIEMADYCVREGMDGGRLTWGIYLRNHNVRVATFLPGFPRAVATLKDVFDAANENRKFFRDGRPVSVSSRQLRDVPTRPDLPMSPARLARTGVPELAAMRR